jgi:CBS domain-containing protein
MLLFSRLRRYTLIDTHGRRGRIVDFIVELLAEDYPPITHIIFRHRSHEREVLGWDQVVSVDHENHRIEVKDVEAGQLAPAEFLLNKVLLSDIDDALVLDLKGLRATRANGLLLREVNGRVVLSAVDTSVSALLRHVTGGRFGYVPSDKLHDWTTIEFLRGDPDAVRSGMPYRSRIKELPAGEIARLTAQLPYMHAAELLTLLPDPLAINTLEAMTARRRLQVFEELSDERALELLEIMAPDVAADLLGTIETERMQRYLEHLSPKRSARIVELLGYPEHCVGGIMTNDIVFAPMRLTVAEAREKLRDRLKEPDFVYLIFIVEDEVSKKQRGILQLRELLTRDDNETLEEIMDIKVPTLGSLESAEKAAFKVIESQLAALPVVGEKGELLGAVTVDAAVLQAAPESWGSQAPRIFS